MKNITLVQLKIGESQASCEALQMAFSWGLYTLFCLFMTNKGSWPSPAKSFSLPSLQIYICSFCKKVVQRHMSRSFSSIRMFRRSLSCNFPFQQSGIGKNVNVSNMLPRIMLYVNEKNCFLNSRKHFISVFEKGTVGASECLYNISVYLLCKSYKKVCYMKHLPLHSPFY